MDNIMNSANALMGKLSVGGGKRRKSRKSSVKKVPKKYKMGYFGGDNKYFMCTEVPTPQPPAPATQPTNPTIPLKPTVEVQSGGASRIAEYKKYLDNMTVDRLQRMATIKGIKITKKKDGKTVYVKKATLVNKLCEYKHGKKRSRKSSKKTSKKLRKARKMLRFFK